MVITVISSGATPSEISETQADELQYLGLITSKRGRVAAERYPIGRILDELALAGAISALAGYQSALTDLPANLDHLRAINNAIRSMDNLDPQNLLLGAFLDYQFHREIIAISQNQPAAKAYDKAIRPALWLHGAQFFAQDDARSSIAEHDRIVSALEKRDALRARDAIAYHFENAIEVLRKGARDRCSAYPATS